MPSFKRRFAKWKSRAASSKPRSERQVPRTDSRPASPTDHRSGAEGHAFQVNDTPERPNEATDAHHHGAEGHAFQVNKDPQQPRDHADDLP